MTYFIEMFTDKKHLRFVRLHQRTKQWKNRRSDHNCLATTCIDFDIQLIVAQLSRDAMNNLKRET